MSETIKKLEILNVVQLHGTKYKKAPSQIKKAKKIYQNDDVELWENKPWYIVKIKYKYVMLHIRDIKEYLGET